MLNDGLISYDDTNDYVLAYDETLNIDSYKTKNLNDIFLMDDISNKKDIILQKISLFSDTGTSYPDPHCTKKYPLPDDILTDLSTEFCKEENISSYVKVNNILRKEYEYDSESLNEVYSKIADYNVIYSKCSTTTRSYSQFI